MEIKTRISIIGGGTCSEQICTAAENLGRLLVKKNFSLVCGGLGGVMQAASKGAFQAGGQVIGILPGNDPKEANPYVSIPITTGLGPMRNYLVVLNGAAVIAVDGKSGTLSEIALAQKIGKKVICLYNWQDLPGVLAANSPKQALEILCKLQI